MGFFFYKAFYLLTINLIKQIPNTNILIRKSHGNTLLLSSRVTFPAGCKIINFLTRLNASINANNYIVMNIYNIYTV